jgi:GNAT superfamily N-acetyltransferase
MTSESEISYKIAWQKKDKKISKDACRLWTEMGAIREPSQGIERSQLLCVVAYDGDKMVAVSTIQVGPQPQVYSKACFFRCVVHPDYRRRRIATELAKRCLVVTEEWSLENPSYQVLAFVIRVETPLLVLKSYKPVWNNKLNFIGYTQEGLPLYLYWFKHAQFGEKQDSDFTFYPSRPGRLGRI